MKEKPEVLSFFDLQRLCETTNWSLYKSIEVIEEKKYITSCCVWVRPFQIP